MKSSKKRTTLTTMFLSYPYKKKISGILGNEGRYHFPKELINEAHPLSLNRTEFLKIGTAIFQEVYKELLEGKQIKLGFKLGTLELKKYRPKTKSINWEDTNKIYGEHNKLYPQDKKYIYHKIYHF